MNDIFLPVEEQSNLDRFQQHLYQVKEAQQLAIAQNESNLADEYQKLQLENKVLKARLVATTNLLQEKEIRLKIEKANLRQENKRLLNLAQFSYALTFMIFLILFFT